MATATNAERLTAAGEPDTTGFTGMQKMARMMWIPWLLMGTMIVVASFVVGIINAGANVSTYFEQGKAAREAAAAGSALVSDRVGMEMIKAWLPGVKFLGMGFIFGGITFAVATILGTLRNAGYRVQRAAGVEPQYPVKPWEAGLFPMLMMMGFMILIADLIVSIWLAAQAATYWDHSIASELNPAQAGDALLASLGRMSAVKAWLEPLKFVGTATMLAGIGLALATIIKVLRFQSGRMVDILQAHEGHA